MSPRASSRPGIWPIDSGSSPRKGIERSHGRFGNARLEVAGELVDLPAQVHVLEQRLGEPLELGALLGRHRVEELLHLGHRLGHLLEQLVEALGVAGEEVPVAVHELLGKSGSSPRSRCSSIWFSSDSMSFIRCMRSGRHVLHALGHLVEVALHQLLAQLVHELLEALPRAVVHPVARPAARPPCRRGRAGASRAARGACRRGRPRSPGGVCPRTDGPRRRAGRCPRAPGRRSRAAARRCRRRHRRGRSGRACCAAARGSFFSMSRRPIICWPSRSRMPCCMSRRSDAWRSPWYSRSSVISSRSASASRSKPCWVPSQAE